MTNLIYVLVDYYPKYLISIILYSLINLDKLEKRRKKNIKKDSDSSMDDDLFSKISRSSNKRKKKAKAKKESLMDHLKRIENGNISPTVETDSDTEGSVHQISKINDMPVSNEALMSEANRIAKENLLNSSDSNGKRFNGNRIIVHEISFKYKTFKIYNTTCSQFSTLILKKF